jgi:PPK2 family polyphosphate:nucleotide phosphotransferase
VDTSRYRIEPGSTVDLSDWPTGDTEQFGGGKQEGKAELQRQNEQLAELQDRLYSEHRRKLLVVLQGMDTSGKDGTIKHVFRSINPSGVEVAVFKQPSETELAHDYLWRVHPRVPGAGHITIFNRSHYEDVLIVRVHGLVAEDVWQRRYRHIREFERLLADEGTTIRKFFLHISKDEQRKRLQARLDDPSKNWKFERGDIDERKRWDDYQQAYADALTETSTEWAPWYVVPADHKWYRNLVVSRVLIETVEALDPQYPEAEPGITDLTID